MAECNFISDRDAMPLVAVLAVLVLAIAVAGCTTERTAYAAGEQSEMVEVLDHEFTAVGYNTLGIEGTLKNIHDERLSSVTVIAKFYDDDDVMIGDGRTTVRNLDPGETALFTIRYYGDGFPDRAKIDEIRVIE